MKKKIRIGIIGGGLNSAVGYAHISAIRLSNNFEISCACFSRNTETNIQTAEFYGIANKDIYSDYKSMLEKRRLDIDAVVILTPSNQHYEQIDFLAGLKIPIICEKSLVSNFNELETIKNKYTNSFISVVFNYLTYPLVIELKKMIEAGHLGKIHQIHIEMPQEGFLRFKDGSPLTPQTWRLEDGDIPTLSLDLATHTYSLVRFLTGQKPLDVVAIQNSYGNFRHIIDDINCLIKYSNEMTCNMWYSKSALGYRNGLRFRVFGSESSAEWYQLEPEILRMSDKTGKIWLKDRGSDNLLEVSSLAYNRFKVGHPAGFIEAMSIFYDNVYVDISNYMEDKLHTRRTFGLEESEECMRLLRSISTSCKEKKWVEIC
jgi:predicted dehydrogenase